MSVVVEQVSEKSATSSGRNNRSSKEPIPCLEETVNWCLSWATRWPLDRVCFPVFVSSLDSLWPILNRATQLPLTRLIDRSTNTTWKGRWYRPGRFSETRCLRWPLLRACLSNRTHLVSKFLKRIFPPTMSFLCLCLFCSNYFHGVSAERMKSDNQRCYSAWHACWKSAMFELSWSNPEVSCWL